MAWPDNEQLPIGVYAAFGADLSASPATWVFTPLTDRLEGNPIPIRRGASDGAGEASAGTCSVPLRNDDGELTPRQPMSSLYPNVDLNTPILVDVGRISPITDSDAFSTNSTNSLGTSDRGRAWQTFSAGGAILVSDYQVTGGAATLSVPSTLAYRAGWIAVNATDVDVYLDVSAAVTVAGGPIEPGNVLMRVRDITHYYMCRLSVAVGGAVTVSIYATGASELLASAVSSVTWSSGVPLRIHAQCLGTWVRAKVYRASDPEPDAWTVTAIATDYLTAGGVGFRSGVASGNSNTKPVLFAHDNFSVSELPAVRMDGFADSWEPAFIPTSDLGKFVSGVQLTASGILRRLGQGAPDGRSALRRALDASSPLAYWPMEDGEDSTQAASGIIGGTPMVVERDVMNFVNDGPAGSLGSAQPKVSADNALAGAISGGAATTWQMSVWTRGVESATQSYYVPFEVRTTTGKILRLIMQNASTIAGIAEYDTETLTTPTNSLGAAFSTYGPAMNGAWHLLQATFTQVGSNVSASFYYDGTLASSGTWVGVTLGAPVSSAAIGRFGGTAGDISKDMEEIYVAHAAVHNTATVVDQYIPGIGHAGEFASDRIARICAAAGIPVLIDDGDSEALGPQPASRDIEIIRDAVRTDMGLLTEYMFGLRFRPRSTRYNLSPSLTVDLSTYRYPGDADPDSILAPVYDDQQIRNDWTVSRPNGSSAQARDEAHADRYGTYDDSTDVNVATDPVLPSHAWWRVHLGTWMEMRYPTMPLHLESNPDLLDEWLALQVGDRVDRINLPAQHPPGPISQIVGGYSEVLAPTKWTVTASCAPYGPWEVAVADGDQRVPADGSTAAALLAAGATTLALASTTANGLWIAGDTGSRPDDFPMDIRVGGEQTTASAIGPSATDSFTRTTSGGWGTATSGQVWSVGSGTPANFSTNGTTGLIAVAALNAEQHITFDVGSANPQEMQLQCLLPVTPTGAGMNWGVLLRWVDANNYVWIDTQVNTDSSLTLRMVKRVAGTATLISSAAIGTAHSTSVARILRARVDGNNLYARVYSATGTDLGGWELTATDTGLPSGTRAGVVARVMTGNTNVGGGTFTFDNLSMLSPQAVTLSARGVNGVTRTWPAGTPVDVWAPAIAAL